LKSMVAKNARLIEGPIQKTLILLTIPMIFGGLSMVIFNLTDTFFVGQLGTVQLAALSFTFPVILFVNSLAHGVAIGASAVISRAFGKGDHKKVKRLTTDSLILSLLFVGFVVGVGPFTIEPLFHLLGASSEVMPYIVQYMTIWYLSVIFMVFPMIANNAIRASGDTKIPGIIVVFAAIINIILDPILIFGLGPVPRLEIVGAAIATTIARAIMSIMSLMILHYKEDMLAFELPSSKSVVDNWVQVLYIGLPAAGTKLVLPIATGVITSMVAIYGSSAVAGFGVATRVEYFAIVVITALGSVIGPFIGQNWGASRFDRIKSGIKFSFELSLIWGLIVFAILAFLGGAIGSVFSSDPDVISVTRLYLLIVPIGYGLYGILVIATSAMSVLKKPIHASTLSFTQTFILYIPLAYFGSHLFGLLGIFIALTISYFVSGIIANFMLNRVIIYRENS